MMSDMKERAEGTGSTGQETLGSEAEAGWKVLTRQT